KKRKPARRPPGNPVFLSFLSLALALIGGSVWGSNPPAAPLGAGTLVLKTRRAAGPLALPRRILPARPSALEDRGFSVIRSCLAFRTRLQMSPVPTVRRP